MNKALTRPVNLTQNGSASQKVALVVVDMQFGSGAKKEWARRATLEDRLMLRKYKSICSLVSGARKAGVPVFPIEFEDAPHQPTDPEIVELAGESARLPIIKNKQDGFEGTSLENELRKEGIETIIMAGSEAIACLFKTAKSAVERGFKVATSWKVMLRLHSALDKPKQRQEATDFYNTKLALYSTVGELIDLMERTFA